MSEEGAVFREIHDFALKLRGLRDRQPDQQARKAARVSSSQMKNPIGHLLRDDQMTFHIIIVY